MNTTQTLIPRPGDLVTTDASEGDIVAQVVSYDPATDMVTIEDGIANTETWPRSAFRADDLDGWILTPTPRVHTVDDIVTVQIGQGKADRTVEWVDEQIRLVEMVDSHSGIGVVVSSPFEKNLGMRRFVGLPYVITHRNLPDLNPRPVVKTTTRELEYFGARAVQVTEHHDSRLTGDRTVTMTWLDDADPRNGSAPAGSVVRKRIKGDGRTRAFEVIVPEHIVTP